MLMDTLRIFRWGGYCLSASVTVTTGISITEKPSMMTMAKLAMDSEVREVSQRVCPEFQI